MLRQDKALLDRTEIFNLRAARDYKEIFGVEEVAFAGFPVAGYSGSAIVPLVSVGISALSEHQEACWQFLRQLLTDRRNYEAGESLPIYKELLDEMAEFEMTPVQERKYSEGVGFVKALGNGYWHRIYLKSEAEYGDRHLTRAEVDQVIELITSADAVLFNENPQITAIISEEIEPFFAGHKTARQAAEIIQTRMELYVAETIN
jgi:ABC-type glycerol-3-phosphate transport system substrate-binding protein